MKKERKELNVQIGARIKECRENAGLTQEKLSEEIDVSVQYISDLERGVVGAAIPTMIKICNTLRTSSDYIMMGRSSDFTYSAAIQQIQSLSDEEQALVDKGVYLLIEAFQCGKKPRP